MPATITLKRGAEERVVTFSPLPFNRRTLSIVERAQKSDPEAIIEAVELSLAVHHGEAEARQIVEGGFIPWPTQGDALFASILSAAMPWRGTPETGGAGV